MNNNAINPVAPNELIDLAQVALAADAFLYIVGSGGAGKTSIVMHDIAPALKRRPYYVNLCGQGPQEVIGYGLPQSNGDMKFAAPDIWPTFDRVGDEPILLFLDEFPDYDPAVRALLRSLYPASGSRYVGPHKLGSDVFIVVAGNRRQDGTKAQVEDAPFTNRCVKCTIEPSIPAWLDWYDKQAGLKAAGSHVPAFLKFGNGEAVGSGTDYFNPPIAQPYDGAPHPTPRSWEKVCLAEPIRKTSPQTFLKFAKGTVGDRAALAYCAFLQHVDHLPDIGKLKADPDSYNVPSDPATQYALVSACLNTATSGVRDIPAAVHAGGFDWLVSLLLRCRGDIREYGARSAVRRGIPLDEHPQSNKLVIA